MNEFLSSVNSNLFYHSQKNKFNIYRKEDKFDFFYFKINYYTDLLFLYKIVHNKDLYFNYKINQEFNKFCTFVWNIKNNQYKMKNIKVSMILNSHGKSMILTPHEKQIFLNERQINEIWYIYDFLKNYDYTEQFFKYLTYIQLENYLVSNLIK